MMNKTLGLRRRLFKLLKGFGVYKKFYLYHGTSRSIARRIQIEGFKIDHSRFCSYGNGIYAYDNYERALRHATECFDVEPCVIRFCISGNCVKMNWSELDRFDGNIIDKTVAVIDASVDDGIYVVRPEFTREIDILEVI